jgi:hypothetical protein
MYECSEAYSVHNEPWSNLEFLSFILIYVQSHASTFQVSLLAAVDVAGAEQTRHALHQLHQLLQHNKLT